MTPSAYCIVADVQALNMARSIGMGSNPGPSQVQTYIDMIAGEINSVLVQKGYQAPVNTGSWPVAAQLLRSVNAKGAWAMMESSAPNSLTLDRAKAAYDEAMKLLSDAKFAMDTDMNQLRTEPRAPWITFMPTGKTYDPTLAEIGGAAGDGISSGTAGNDPKNPFFSRQMRF